MARKDDDDANDLAEARSRNLLTPAWMAAFAIALIVVAGLVILLVWGRGNPSSAQPTGAGSIPPTATPTSSSGTGQNVPAGWKPCSYVAHPNSSVNGKSWEEFTAPPATTWRDLNGQMLPTTAGGPFRYDTDGGSTLARCYTPDALGALTALAQIEMRSYAPGGRIVRIKQTVPGSSLSSKSGLAAYDKNPPQPPGPQMVGFRFNAPIANNATSITTQLKFGSNYQVPITWQVQWTGTDWVVGNARPEIDDPNSGSKLIFWRAA